MDKVHMTPKGPKPCRATKRSCKYGEHFESRDEAEKIFEEKLNSQTSSLSKEKTILNAIIKTVPLQNGKITVADGRYYQILSEGFQGTTEAFEFLFYRGGEPRKNPKYEMFDTFGAYTVNGELLIVDREGWSGITNSLLSEKLYNTLVKDGHLEPDAGNFIEFNSTTTFVPYVEDENDDPIVEEGEFLV